MLELYEQWQASGKSKTAFAGSHGIRPKLSLVPGIVTIENYTKPDPWEKPPKMPGLKHLCTFVAARPVSPTGLGNVFI